MMFMSGGGHRVLEMYESIRIIKNCLAKMTPGEIDSNPKVVAPGEGIVHFLRNLSDKLHYRKGCYPQQRI